MRSKPLTLLLTSPIPGASFTLETATVSMARSAENTVTTNKKGVCGMKMFVALVIAITIAFGALHICDAAQQYVPYGINFSPYIKDQDPSTGTLIISPSQVASRLAKIRGRAQWIRTFSTTKGMETAGALAHKVGFKTAIGAWIGVDQSSNTAEINNLIAAANRGEVDVAIVGSEVMLRNDISSAALIQYIQQVKAAIPTNILVTTDDTYDVLIAHPEVVAVCDIVMANIYPYWEGVRIDSSIAALNNRYWQLKTTYSSKKVLIGETGWPSAGTAVGSAVPSPANAAYYFLAFNSLVRANSVKSFYFEAFDEAWKAESEGLQGAHWGINTASGGIKPGMTSVYAGITLPQSIFMRTPPSLSLPGSASIKMTTIPAYGASDGTIKGYVTGIPTAQYVVAVYIYAYYGWWSKPTWAAPAVAINQDGSFSCQTVTGGVDNTATSFYLFLVPASYSIPLGEGGDIPSDIYSHAVAQLNVSRPPGFPGSSTPMPSLEVKTLRITRLWSSGVSGTDRVSVAGTIPIESGWPSQVPGAEMVIKIGETSWQFDPLADNGTAKVASGSWTNSTGSIAVKASKNGNSWSYVATLNCSSGNPDWNKYGLTNATIGDQGIPVFLPVTVSIFYDDYIRLTAGYYKSKAGVSGSIKASSSTYQ